MTVVVDAMARPGLVLTEIALLREILLRRDPDIAPVAEGIDLVPLDPEARERARRAIVDELCELPDGQGGRRALELSELLVHLAPQE